MAKAGSTQRPARYLPPLLNGRLQPEPISLRAGVSYRFRIVNIRADIIVAFELRGPESIASWRPVAKDGAELPPSQSAARPAFMVLAPGEIYDVEFTPTQAGELTLRYGFLPQLRPQPIPVTVTFPPLVTVPVHVR